MSVVAKLMILCVAALAVTIGLVVTEWRTKQLARGTTGAKVVVGLLVLGVLISLLIVR